MKNDEIAISVSGVSKGFKLPLEKQTTIKSALINFKKRGFQTQHVLENISLDIKKGEFFGIVGRNGSGKSTLLKLLAGIYTPDKGKIKINGKLTPFIELGVGFNPELSGRDNVYLNGALLGFNRKEMNAMYDEIVEFAELGRFMDQKLKNYSSGMQVRLAFSIAIQASTDILVLDEVLAVGDEAFQRKCYDYFNRLKQEGKTVILVTHDMGAVRRFCTRVAVINKGDVIYDGNTDEAATIYRELNLEGTADSIKKTNSRRGSRSQNLMNGSKITELETIDSKGVAKVLFASGEKVVIKSTIKITKKIKPIELKISFNNPGGVPLTSLTAVVDEKTIQKALVGDGNVSLQWTVDGVFNDGKYLVSAIVTDKETSDTYSHLISGCEFDIFGWDETSYIIHMDNAYKLSVGK